MYPFLPHSLATSSFSGSIRGSGSGSGSGSAFVGDSEHGASASISAVHSDGTVTIAVRAGARGKGGKGTRLFQLQHVGGDSRDSPAVESRDSRDGCGSVSGSDFQRVRYY